VAELPKVDRLDLAVIVHGVVIEQVDAYDLPGSQSWAILLVVLRSSGCVGFRPRLRCRPNRLRKLLLA